MTFLEKYQLLKKSIPVPAVTIGPYTVDCEYVDNVFQSNNCYYCFDSAALEDSLYATMSRGDKLIDCTAVFESEKCYESIDSTRCQNSTNLLDCNNCTDCHFSVFLNNCTDCFVCVALNNKKYCILNIQYAKEEYFKKVEELKKEKTENLLAQLFELKQKIPHPASQQFNSENCPYGNYIYDSKNCYWAFNMYSCENSGYIYQGYYGIDCWDVYLSGRMGNQKGHPLGERLYELVATGPSCYDCAFLVNCTYCTNSYYSAYLRNCSDCFGCVGLTNKKYCILNNQLTKYQYEKALKEIKKELGWRT